MTTGTTGTAGAPAAGFTGLRRYANWSGTDGKYEVYQGLPRSKWNSYTVDRRSLFSANGNIGFRCPMGHTVSYPVAFTWYSSSTSGSDLASFSTAEKNAMLAKILDKAKGHSFNAGVNLAQMGQVSNMVCSNLGKLGRSIMALKHGDFATAARQLGAAPRNSKLKSDDISGRWLELQYGWLPALSDTYEASKAFAAISEGPQSARVSTGRVKTGRIKILGATAADRLTLSQERVLNYTYEMREELSFGRQLGLMDPLSIAWELIPYSFVVDWFIPIGTYLSDLNQVSRLLGRWMVTESKLTRGVAAGASGQAFSFCPTHGTKQFTGIVSYPSIVYSRTESTRSALASPPKVYFPPFRVGGAVHGTRILNAIALATQRFLR